MPGFDANTIVNNVYDVEKAKELMAESSYPEGFEVEFKTISGVSEKIAQMVQSDLSQIGITVTIQLMEPSAFLQDVSNLNYEMGWFGLDSRTIDLAMFNTLLSTGGDLNVMGWSSTDYDEANEVIMTNTDQSMRADMVPVIQAVIDTECPIIPLFWKNSVTISAKDLEGFENTTRVLKYFNLHW